MDTERQDSDSYREWTNRKTSEYIKLTEEIFDEKGMLKIFTDERWADSSLQRLDDTTVPEWDFST